MLGSLGRGCNAGALLRALCGPAWTRCVTLRFRVVLLGDWPSLSPGVGWYLPTERKQGQGGYVMGRFPRVVLWEGGPGHHVSLLVDRPNNRVGYYCVDCDECFSFEIQFLEAVKRIIAEDDDVQVVGWCEIDG